MEVVKRNGAREALDIHKIQKCVEWACEGLSVSQSEVETASQIQFFNGITTANIQKALIKAASELISVEAPDYTYVAARLLLQSLFKQVNDGKVTYPSIKSYLTRGIEENKLDSRLGKYFDYEAIDRAIVADRDLMFDYLGLQTLADRYFVRANPRWGNDVGELLELPQHFWMRVAMGLALAEAPADRTKYAIAFYNVLSQFKFVSSTPTLFNSGTPHSQMSSCYLNSVADSLISDRNSNEHASIFGTINECAALSKWAGGIGTDWTRVRASGGVIKGTGGRSSGIVPYLKVFNDTAVAVNQGGKRNGAFAAYLEPWHADALRFIDLKKNVGDHRLRAHDIFTAWWIPDLFFKRLEEKGAWSFFDPATVPELHEVYGEEFEAIYAEYEDLGLAVGTIPAEEFWRKILSSLFETGGPWITFKDECNRRSPQDHVGVIHNSNLCTEITLNTSDDETAVCNLGSVNFARCEFHEFKEVIGLAVRMLDNVIDLNYYPSDRSRASNMKHRPIGLGVMGWAEFIVSAGVDFETEGHLRLTDYMFEWFSYYAITSSALLAAERGSYQSFLGSKWSRGILPIDTARELDAGWSHLGDRPDWDAARKLIKNWGMRNSNVMAIAPTATIANIVGTTECTQLPYKTSYTKENLSGVFVVVDPTLKYGDPTLAKTSMEVDQEWIIKAAAVRQKWLDQAQSVNLYAKKGTRGRDLDVWYRLAHKLGLKTTYYLKSQVKEVGELSPMQAAPAPVMSEAAIACSIDNPEACEACQ